MNKYQLALAVIIGFFDRTETIFNLLIARVSAFKADAKSYTDQKFNALSQSIAGMDFSLFGGRTKTQWETYVQQTATDKANAAVLLEKDYLESLSNVAGKYELDVSGFDPASTTPLTEAALAPLVAADADLPTKGKFEVLVRVKKTTDGDATLTLTNTNLGLGASQTIGEGGEIIAYYNHVNGVKTLIKLVYYANVQLAAMQSLKDRVAALEAVDAAYIPVIDQLVIDVDAIEADVAATKAQVEGIDLNLSTFLTQLKTQGDVANTKLDLIIASFATTTPPVGTGGTGGGTGS